MTIPVLVVGFGQWGKLWVSDLQADPRFALAGVVDRSAKCLAGAAAEHGVPPGGCYDSLAPAIEAGPAGVAVVTVPPEQHFPVVHSLVDAGWHILSEKPLATSFADALRMRDLARQANVHFMVSQDYRWQPPIQTLRQQIAAGAVGELGFATYRHFQTLRIGGWREEMAEVLLEDMAIHHFDILRAVTGLDCLSVYAESYNPAWSWYRGGACTSVQLTFEQQFRVHYFGTWVATGPQDSWPGEVRIEGSRGALTLDAHGRVFLHQGEDRRELPLAELPQSGRKRALDEMYRAVTEGRAPETTIDDNLRSFAIVQAALESVHLNRPVALQELYAAGDPAGSRTP